MPTSLIGPVTSRPRTRTPSLRLISEDFRTRPDVKLPNSDLLAPVRAVEEMQVDLEPDGSFSLLVGPGRYEFVPVKGSPGIPFELTDQTEYQVEVPPL